MGKYFVRDTPLAGLEREMMLPPNFTPRGSSSAILCGYSPHGVEEDIADDSRHAALDRATAVVRATSEYMSQMETAPSLTASGLEGDYRVLADLTARSNALCSNI